MQQREEHFSPSMLQELRRSSTRFPPTRVGREIGNQPVIKEYTKFMV
jgi:hypothetical protein